MRNGQDPSFGGEVSQGVKLNVPPGKKKSLGQTPSDLHLGTVAVADFLLFFGFLWTKDWVIACNMISDILRHSSWICHGSSFERY